jgi:phosphatidate cytidylyltransferase
MLRARVLTALVLLCVFVSALFWLPDPGWNGFVSVIIGLAAWEWGGLAGFRPRSRAGFGALSALLLFAASSALFHSEAGMAHGSPILLSIYGLAAVFWLVVVPLWLVRKWRLKGGMRAAAVGWVVLLPAALVLVQVRSSSPAAILAAMAAVWIADIGAYFAGRAFGRHKLAPQISPGKTWEGALGATLALVSYGLLVLDFRGLLAGFGAGAMLWLVLGLVALTAVSICGDLFESLLKRQAGVKDSGQLLPGHGGVLDRIDSLTSTLPWVGIVFLLWRS